MLVYIYTHKIYRFSQFYFDINQVSSEVSTQLYSTLSGSHLYYKMIGLVQKHYDLASTTVTGIPMKVGRGWFSVFSSNGLGGGGGQLKTHLFSTLWSPHPPPLFPSPMSFFPYCHTPPPPHPKLLYQVQPVWGFPAWS